jgi:tRNA (Thr-GGU) A37 N-methylase
LLQSLDPVDLLEQEPVADVQPLAAGRDVEEVAQKAQLA